MTVGRGCRAVRAAVFAAVCVLLASVGHALMSETAVPWWALAVGGVAVGAAGWSIAGRQRGPLSVVAFTVAAQAVLHAFFSFAQASGRSSAPQGPSIAQQWARYLLCGAEGSRLSDAQAAHLVARSSFGDRLRALTPMAVHGGAAHSTAGVQPSAGHQMAGMAHHMSGMGAMAGTAHGADSMTHGMAAMSPWGMLAAHALAALLSGLWLAWGESAAFRIARTLTHWAFAPLRLALPTSLPPTRFTERPLRTLGVRTPRRLLLVHAITTRGPPPGTAVA